MDTILTQFGGPGGVKSGARRRTCAKCYGQPRIRQIRYGRVAMLEVFARLAEVVTSAGTSNPEVLLAVIGTLLGTLLGALIGAASTYALAHRQIRAAAQLQREQHEHDETERQRERELQLRREVYLEAADALARLQAAVSSFSAETTPERLTEILAGVGTSQARVSFVASLPTLQAYSQLQPKFVEIMFDMVELSIRFNRRRDGLEALQAESSRLAETQQQMVKFVRSLQPELRKAHEPQLLQDYLAHQGRLDALRQQISNEGVQLAEHRMQLVVASAEAAHRLGGAVKGVIVSIRRELGFELTHEEYSNVVDDGSSRAREILHARIGRLKEEFGPPT